MFDFLLLYKMRERLSLKVHMCQQGDKEINMKSSSFVTENSSVAKKKKSAPVSEVGIPTSEGLTSACGLFGGCNPLHVDPLIVKRKVKFHKPTLLGLCTVGNTREV